MISHIRHSCDASRLNVLICVSAKMPVEQTIFHSRHICEASRLNVLNCVSAKVLV